MGMKKRCLSWKLAKIWSPETLSMIAVATCADTDLGGLSLQTISYCSTTNQSPSQSASRTVTFNLALTNWGLARVRRVTLKISSFQKRQSVLFSCIVCCRRSTCIMVHGQLQLAISKPVLC